MAPELARLTPKGSGVAGSLLPGGWLLCSSTVRDQPGSCVVVDDRWRLSIPPGVRHRLGIVDQVVVSATLDRSRVVVWAAETLDEVVEAGP
jgi:hypothetical protein